MKVGPKHHWAQSRAMPMARALVAMVVALSFFAMIVPFGLASTGETGLMACCIGKPGHESGSCNTDLPESLAKPQPEPEILCGQKPPAIEIIEVVSQFEDGDHCSHHAPSTTTQKSGAARIHALEDPCSEECGACSVSYTRRPRPREQSTLTLAVKPRLPSALRFSPADYSQTRTLHRKYLQLQPRAPPAPRA